VLDEVQESKRRHLEVASAYVDERTIAFVRHSVGAPPGAVDCVFRSRVARRVGSCRSFVKGARGWCAPVPALRDGLLRLRATPLRPMLLTEPPSYSRPTTVSHRALPLRRDVMKPALVVVLTGSSVRGDRHRARRLLAGPWPVSQRHCCLC
jgi:hypothetical protein